SHSDFEQTNVLPFVPPEGLLGVTEFLKQRVALPFTGSYFDFRHTLRHELVHVFQLSLTNQAFARYPRVRHVDPPLGWTEGVAAEPLSITARVLTKLAIKPAVYGAPERADSARGVLYFSPSTGYTNIYAQSFAGGRPRAVVKGERSAEFESFHFFESRIGVS